MNQNGKFDPKKLHKLNDPDRLIDIPPDYIWDRLDIEKETPEVLVEIGAGTAFFCRAFLEHAEGATIYACDVSDVMLDWVRENVVPVHPGIVPVKTGKDRVPLDDGIADLVYMINLHHELDTPSGTLAEAFRIMKPGAALFIADWKKKEMPDGPPEKIRCSAEKVKEQLINTGFQNVHIDNGLEKHFLITAQTE